MKQLVFVLITTASFCSAVFTQTTQFLCQKIIITAPERAQPEESVKISVAFEKDSSNSTAAFNWTIIKNEQLTKISNANFIEIKANEMGNHSPVIVLADAVETKCQNTAIANIYTIKNIDFTNLDEFGKITWSEERFRLENALIVMRQDKEMSLFIFYNYDKKLSV